MAHWSGTHTWSKTWTRWSALSIHVQCCFSSIETATSTFTQPPSSEWCTERNAACFITIKCTHTSNIWPTHTRGSYIRNNKCDPKAAVFALIKTAVDWNHLVNAAVHAQSEKEFQVCSCSLSKSVAWKAAINTIIHTQHTKSNGNPKVLTEVFECKRIAAPT